MCRLYYVYMRYANMTVSGLSGALERDLPHGDGEGGEEEHRAGAQQGPVYRCRDLF